jgi:transmembrane sensor
MNPLPIYNDLPWEMIASALLGTLSASEALSFKEWLALSPGNQNTYNRLQEIWTDKMTDYSLYREANEDKAWDTLQKALSQRSGGKVISLFSRWLAVAAIFLLVAGAGWWYYTQNNIGIVYKTALEQKKLSLSDGSTVLINPETRILVANGYNKTGRTIILEAGEAHFDISHQAQLPFIVDADVITVKDIGTSFSVQKTPDSIKVTVTAGKVAFLKKETGESRELSAGSHLTYYINARRWGNMNSVDVGSLRFDDTPLSQIITALEKKYGKKIDLADPMLGQKRLTIHLDGESLDEALKIICTSLNLESVKTNDIYLLSSGDNVIQNH